MNIKTNILNLSKNIKTNTLKNILFLMILVVMPLNNMLSNVNNFMSYIDEIFIISLMLTFIICWVNSEFRLDLSKYEHKHEKRILIYLVLLIIIGLVSSFYFNYQPIKYALTELFLLFKFIIAYFCSRYVFKDFDIRNIENIIIKICNFLTITMFLLLLSDIIFNVFGTIGYRFGIKAYNLVFSHPTYLAGFAIIMICFYTFSNKNDKYIFINLILMASTLRNKTLIFIFIYVFLRFLIYLNNKININKSIINMLIVVCGIIIIIIFKDAIVERLLDQGAARNIIYTKALSIAGDHFPLGAGLATFASYLSGKYYSPLYYIYGMYNVHGFTKEDYAYVADAFWAMIVSQFGFVGLILFLIIIYKFIKIINELKNKNLKFSCVVIMIYMLVSSTSEAIFNTYIGVTLFSILAIFICNDAIVEDKK